MRGFGRTPFAHDGKKRRSKDVLYMVWLAGNAELGHDGDIHPYIEFYLFSDKTDEVV